MASIVVDVSVHNGHIDWSQAKKTVTGAIIRCGFGMDMPEQDDRLWADNVTGCERAGVPYAAYLYSYANNAASARSEAKHALRLCKPYHPSVIYFDSEQPGTQLMARECANAFISEIRKAGYKAGLYASTSWYKSYLKGVSCDSLWVAAYGTNNGMAQERYRPNVGEDLWQFTSVGVIPGSGHRCDMNIMYRDIFGKPDAPKPDTPDLLELVARTQEGRYGNGDERVRNLGKNYQAVQEMVNHIYKSSVQALAKDVIAGMFGTGELRKRVLGTRYAEVQAEVNRMLR